MKIKTHKFLVNNMIKDIEFITTHRVSQEQLFVLKYVYLIQSKEITVVDKEKLIGQIKKYLIWLDKPSKKKGYYLFTHEQLNDLINKKLILWPDKLNDTMEGLILTEVTKKYIEELFVSEITINFE